MKIGTLAQLLAVSMAAFPIFAAWAARAEVPRVEPPVTHEGVSIYLLKGKSEPGPVPLTLAEALDKGVIEVHETGNVRELKIENTGGEPVFVQLGDIVKGGRQDRVLTVSLLLKPHSGVVPIGAYCVEQGRWSARGTENAQRFAASEELLPSREAKVAIAKPAAPAPVASTASPVAEAPRPRSPIEAELNAALRRIPAQEPEQRQGAFSGRTDSQSEVWRNVQVLQKQLSQNLAASVASERSRTSLQLSLENEKLKEVQAAYVAALEPAGLKDDDVVGVAIAIGGRIASADLYPSNGLFRKMWPKIVRAAATEAIALKDRGAEPAPTAAAVTTFLADADKGARSERNLGELTTLETREADQVLSVRAAAPAGTLVHRSYLAK
jgi:hypothetical protein